MAPPCPSDEREKRDYEALRRSYVHVQYQQQREPQVATPYFGDSTCPSIPPDRVAASWSMQSTWSPSQQQERYERQYRQELLAGGKRILLPIESTDDDDAHQHPNSSWRLEPQQRAPAAPVSSRKKQRRPSHIIKQEAKQLLSEQLRHLELQKLLLQQEKGIVDPTSSHAALHYNAKLRDALLHQNLLIATTQSTFSEFATSQASSPLETFIHLGSDREQRRRALLAMKNQKLDVALRFLTQRTLHMNPAMKSYEVSQFESAEGDIRMVRMDVTPIDGATSVRQVYDALEGYLSSSDATIVEFPGEKDGASARPEVLQHRLVRTEQCGALSENNSVLFLNDSKLDSRNVDEQCAVITQDFVDRDDLHPYCPAERLRKDATCVMKLSTHWRTRPATQNPSPQSAEFQETEEEELMIVLTHWVQLRLRRPETLRNVSNRDLQKVADDMLQRLESLIESIREQVGTA